VSKVDALKEGMKDPPFQGKTTGDWKSNTLKGLTETIEGKRGDRRI